MGLFGGLFSRDKSPHKEGLDRGLKKTRETFWGRLSRAVAGRSTVDDHILDTLEETLILADVGVATTLKIIERFQQRVARDKYLSTGELDRLLREELLALLPLPPKDSPVDLPPPKPYVIMVVGVNGTGKTTTIGKLAMRLRKEGQSVLLGAADTFRAAAVEQLQLWGERADVPVVSGPTGADPASVAYEATKRGMDEDADTVIIDTAGRLHTKTNLMNELSKIRRVIKKALPGAPHEALLTLDGGAGQNAVIQAREFTKATSVTGMVVTKLDGTAKGGVVLGIADEFNIPIRYIGVGEQAEDLQTFDQVEFIDSLFKKTS